jgi:hypothetical protein
MSSRCGTVKGPFGEPCAVTVFSVTGQYLQLLVPMPRKIPPKPAWLDGQVYANISEDAATPDEVRMEALNRVAAAPDIDAARAAFSTYISGAQIPDRMAVVPPATSLNHLFYAIGFCKRVAEVVGSGDELTVAAEFAKIRDDTRPRRERRKMLARISRLMDGKPIRSQQSLWLYNTSKATVVMAPHVLRQIDSCVPWQLALPRVSSASEYVHLELPGSAVTGCRVPNCRDAGFDNLELWNHGGITRPHSKRPSSCSASAGLNEVIAATPNYDNATQPLGWCVAA